MGDLVRHTLKSVEKLKRGHYFYIGVGDLFYAGDIKESRVTSMTHPRDTDWILGYEKTKGGSRFANNAINLDRWTRKHYPQETKVVKRELTGKTAPKLAEAFSEAKQFRKYKQAEAACKKLNAVYSGTSTRVIIEFYGDENVYS